MVLQKKKIPFEKYLIPVLPHLQYEKDGNAQDGEVLFIMDHAGFLRSLLKRGWHALISWSICKESIMT